MAFVQSAGVKSDSSAVASLVKAYTSNLGSAADLFAFVVDYYKTTSAISVTITDSKGNAWTQDVISFTSGQITGRIFSAPNSSSGANTVTATFNSVNGQYPGLAIFEAPVGSGMVLDGYQVATGTGTSATVSYTPTADGYAVGVVGSATGTAGDPSGWNVREGSSWSTSGRLNKACDKTATSGVGLTLTSTVTNGAWFALIAVYRVGSSSITGSANATLGAVTSSGASTLSITGSASRTLGAVTSSGSGSLAITAAGSATLGAVTSAGAGTLSIAGTGSVTLDAATSVGSGSLSITGAAAATIGAIASTGTGGSGAVGSGGGTLGAITGSGTGTIGITGAAALTLGTVTSTAAGTLTISGAAASTIGAITGAAAASLGITGAGAATIGAITGTGTGSVPGTTLAVLVGTVVHLDPARTVATLDPQRTAASLDPERTVRHLQ